MTTSPVDGSLAVHPETGPLLAVEDLRIRFQTEDGPVHAVNGVSFELARGEILALVGESGCGKSVTAMSIPGLLPATATVTGSIRLEGTDLLSLSPKQLREVRGKDVSFVFQEPMTSLNPAFTVGRQIREVLQRHEGLSKRAAHQRAIELLELVRIPAPRQRVDEYPHQLSGGMRQRVMIAIGVACGPKILVADEPTTALDVTIQAGVLDILRRLRSELGTSIILITHDLGVVADLADRVVVMYAGRPVEQAEVHELFAHPQHPYTNGLLSAIPHREKGPEEVAVRRLVEIPGLVPSLRSDPDECVFAPRCPRRTEICVEHRPPLEPTRPFHPTACYHPGEQA
ncbi:peptide/nickel transport system ATP-binding protein [Blastococcus colisei]|uniref:Peptide/nickel transport system ATP-binding protein n=1 Tax=Blastococcus colisei TaxID=1564162 RepID=A0A543PIH9_9ACTN|nr:ABC transporter ATP-binding protein [Blastococcus colisei]TQN43882.1 peptide/nickel transport system ATP-binding protein [Blastococcus colisei]